MRKFFAFFLGFVMSLALLTGCGKSTATPTTDYHGEGEIQGGIKSDEDIAAITQEAEQNTEQPSYEDNTGHEPDAYGTGNFQDYWEGEDYFDLIGFLTAHGYKGFNAYDGYYNHIKDDSQPVSIYGCYSENFVWRIDISHGYMKVCYIGGDPSNPVKEPSYDVYPNQNGETVIIDNRKSTVDMNTIVLLASIVENIDMDSSNMDPMRDTGASYFQQ